MIELPEEKKATIHLLCLAANGGLCVSESDYSKIDCNWIHLASQEVVFGLRELDVDIVTQKCVDGLREKKAKIYANASKEAKKVQEKIDKYLAIGHEKTVETPPSTPTPFQQPTEEDFDEDDIPF